ncbi:MAG: CapA family protein [Chloroflexota bacterium]
MEWINIFKHQTICRLSLSLICLVLFLSGCQPEVPPPLQPDLPHFQIVFLGDLLLADAAQPLLDEHGYTWPFEQIAELIQGDYLIANLEGPITTDQQPWDPDQRWSYNAQPQAAQALAEIGIDALGFSNNHTMDRGSEGIRDTLAHLETNRITAFGAALNQEQAEQPLIIESPHGTVAVVALSSDWGTDRTASENSPGTVPLSKASIKKGYQLAQAAGADWVIGYVHWGSNYTEISDSQRRWGRAFARAGYHLIIGHGAHSLQPVEIINGMPVLYSLGNSIFGTPGRFNEDFPGFGLIAHLEVGPQGFSQLRLNCIQTNNQIVNFQPLPCTRDQAQAVFGSLAERLLIKDNHAVLTW